MNRKSSTSKQHQEWTPWLLPSGREQRRPFTEENELERNQRMRADEDHSAIFGNRRTARNERPPLSSYATSYGQHYNQLNTSM
jgi:hypothetical protein